MEEQIRKEKRKWLERTNNREEGWAMSPILNVERFLSLIHFYLSAHGDFKECRKLLKSPLDTYSSTIITCRKAQ